MKTEQKKKIEKIEEMSKEEKAYRLTLQQLKRNREVFIRLKDK
ncbi:hypothetical protein [Dolosicoccus paucivorans]|nr:hypothetical protein [Dolosicoccus paucivorans]SDI40222.1 hypothetical protein SAMN04487994_10105 [Dolosicoccus paucivorans]